MLNGYSVFALQNIPEIKAGDNLSGILALSLKQEGLKDNDILVLAHKIVSKAEGRVIKLSDIKPGKLAKSYASKIGKDASLVEVILSESSEVLWCGDGGPIICRHKLGFICADAGVDCSNGGREGYAVMLPENPDFSAGLIRQSLEKAFNVKIGVIICDTHGRPFRIAACGVAVGVSGIKTLKSYIGKPDRNGRKMRTSVEGIGDELSAAATLVMGQGAEGLPAAIIRGYKEGIGTDSASSLIRPVKQDIFLQALKLFKKNKMEDIDMSNVSISTSKAPAAIGPYSQAVRSGSLLFVSGQIPIVPETGSLIEGGIEQQANQVFLNLKAILEEAGLTFENVVKTTVLLDDMDNFTVVNKIYGDYFKTKVLPARAAFEVCKLPKGAMIEIELIASYEG